MTDFKRFPASFDRVPTILRDPRDFCLCSSRCVKCIWIPIGLDKSPQNTAGGTPRDKPNGWRAPKWWALENVSRFKYMANYGHFGYLSSISGVYFPLNPGCLILLMDKSCTSWYGKYSIPLFAGFHTCWVVQDFFHHRCIPSKPLNNIFVHSSVGNVQIQDTSTVPQIEFRHWLSQGDSDKSGQMPKKKDMKATTWDICDIPILYRLCDVCL